MAVGIVKRQDIRSCESDVTTTAVSYTHLDVYKRQEDEDAGAAAGYCTFRP